jgi:hypothetical protein
MQSILKQPLYRGLLESLVLLSELALPEDIVSYALSSSEICVYLLALVPVYESV